MDGTEGEFVNAGLQVLAAQMAMGTEAAGLRLENSMAISECVRFDQVFN